MLPEKYLIVESSSMQSAPLAGLDHATYDQYLVALHEKESNWTNANLRGMEPLPKEKLTQDTQYRLTEWLQAQPELSGQDYSDKRPMLRHLSHHLLSHAALYTHHFGAKPAQAVERTRNNLAVLLSYNVLWLDTEDDPMKGYKAERMKLPPNANDAPYYDVYRDKKHLEDDKKIARFLLGKNPHDPSETQHTETLLRDAVPCLMELEPRKITAVVPALRNRIRTDILGHLQFLDPDTRIKILEEIMNDWIDMDEDGRIAYLETLQEELNTERSPDDAIELYDSPFGTVADACFQRLTQQPELSDADRKLLTARTKNVLPFLIHRGVLETKLKPENLPQLQRVYHYLATIPPIIRPNRTEMPHLVLAKSILQSDMTLEQYRSVLH